MHRITHVLLEAVALIALAAGIFVAAASYASLPDSIPIHFGISGKPDGFGHKAWLPVLTVLAIAIYGGLTVARRFPQYSNTPWKITEGNRERQYRLIQSLLTWMKAQTAVLLAYLQWAIVQTAHGIIDGLDNAFMFAAVAVMLLTIAVYMYCGYRAR